MCNLVCTDNTWRVGCGWLIPEPSDSFPRFSTVVFHIGGRDDFLFFFSSVILSISVFLDHMVPSSTGLLHYLLFYASYMLLVCVF